MSTRLRETRRPSADYQTASDVLVEIVEDQTVDVEVVNRLRAGRILIRKTDPNGVPLAGACFDLVEDGAGASCTDENGELLFAALAPGVYRVMETEAPADYLVAPAIDPVTVRPGSTATLDVVDQPAPPPPDSGSIQVRKFVCPVAEGEWRHRLRRLLRPRWWRAGPDRRLRYRRRGLCPRRTVRTDRVPHRRRGPLPDDPRYRGLRADRALDRRVGAADGASQHADDRGGGQLRRTGRRAAGGDRRREVHLRAGIPGSGLARLRRGVSRRRESAPTTSASGSPGRSRRGV